MADLSTDSMDVVAEFSGDADFETVEFELCGKRYGVWLQRLDVEDNKDDDVCSACQYCLVAVGTTRALVVPARRGGTKHQNNAGGLACDACAKETERKLTVPVAAGTGEVDKIDGWPIWKRWGNWVLTWNPKAAEFGGIDLALVFEPLDYWIDIDRVHEPDWHRHLQEKSWMRESGNGFVHHGFHPENWSNFCVAIEFARTLIRKKAPVFFRKKAPVFLCAGKPKSAEVF